MLSVSKAHTNGTNRDIGGEEAFVEKADILRFCLLPTASSGRHASARSAAPWEGDKIALTSEFPCCHDPIRAIRGQSFFMLSESEKAHQGAYELSLSSISPNEKAEQKSGRDCCHGLCNCP